jgi:orotidine-5'-phosphate decarboxylase
LLKDIKTFGKKNFLDLKLHDIPNTVAETVRAAVRHGIEMLTLHSSGGMEMIDRASDSAAAEAERLGVNKPILLAVTVLTSLRTEDLHDIGIPSDTLPQVLRLARLARRAGMEGVVCSPHEIETVKKETGKDFLVVVPGIRPSSTAADDQKRILTPSLAFEKGADYLVIGRPIIEAPSPQKAFLRIVEELNQAGQSS